MSRLTNDFRNAIITSAMKNAFAAEAEEIAKAKREFGEKVYRSIVSEAMEKQAMKAPKELLSLCNADKLAVHLYEKAQQYHPTVIKGVTGLLNRPLPRSYAEQSRYDRINVYNADALIEEADKILAMEKVRDEKLQELRTAIRATVYSVGTVKRLLEVWPESKAFIPADAFQQAKSSSVPALPIDGLNKLLRLAGVQLTAA